MEATTPRASHGCTLVKFSVLFLSSLARYYALPKCERARARQPGIDCVDHNYKSPLLKVAMHGPDRPEEKHWRILKWQMNRKKAHTINPATKPRLKVGSILTKADSRAHKRPVPGSTIKAGAAKRPSSKMDVRTISRAMKTKRRVASTRTQGARKNRRRRFSAEAPAQRLRGDTSIPRPVEDLAQSTTMSLRIFLIGD